MTPRPSSPDTPSVASSLRPASSLRGAFAFGPLAFALLLVAGCGDSPPDTTPTPPADASDDDVRERPDIGSPDVALPDDADADEDGTDDALPDVPEAVCEPDATRCVDLTTEERCAEDGSAWLAPTPCPNRTICEVDACITAEPCRPGAGVCIDQTTVSVCNDNGFTRRDVACATGETCFDGACVAEVCSPDEKSYLGCEFWVTDLDNYSTGRPLYVSVANVNAYAVDVQITDYERRRTFDERVEAGQVAGFAFSHIALNGTSLTSRTARVTSSAPVTVHQFNPRGNTVQIFSNDASLLLPRGALGRDYRVLGWPTFFSEEVNQSLRGGVAIVSPQADTQVVVTSPVALAAGTGVGAVDAGEPTTFTLGEGQVLTLQTVAANGIDITGLRVQSSADVAVFSYHECANVPTDIAYCDHLEQQMPSVNAWSREIASLRFRPRGTEDTIYRVIASRDGTVLTSDPPIEGVEGVTLDDGEFVEFASRDPFVLTANHPILAGAYMVGSEYPAAPATRCDRSGEPLDDEAPRSEASEDDEDPRPPRAATCAIPSHPACADGRTAIGDPAFLTLVGTSQLLASYRLTVPADYREDWLTVLYREGTQIALDDEVLDLDGALPLGESEWRQIDLPARSGVRSLDADQAIAVYVYGYDCNVSYAYPGGMDLRD